jgi:hypothetical protein
LDLSTLSRPTCLPFCQTQPFLSFPFRNHGSHFEAHKAAFEEGAARDDVMIEDVESETKENSDTQHLEKA